MNPQELSKELFNVFGPFFGMLIFVAIVVMKALDFLKSWFLFRKSGQDSDSISLRGAVHSELIGIRKHTGRIKDVQEQQTAAIADTRSDHVEQLIQTKAQVDTLKEMTKTLTDISNESKVFTKLNEAAHEAILSELRKLDNG